MKTKTIYTCQQCGAQSPKWIGKCPDCDAWNSFVEEQVVAKPKQPRQSLSSGSVVPITEIQLDHEDRISSGIGEFDRILGGGIVAGSLTLVGGLPGIGKSTIMLQVAHQQAQAGRRVLYVSGEESLKQIKRRAERLTTLSDNVLLLSETNLEVIVQQIDRVQPQLLVLDSIQSVYRSDIPSAPGSVSQVRECASQLMYIAKQKHISTFLIGHVTKEGAIAGPRLLEHIVDTVLYFEGDQHHLFRLLRAVKNRYGSTNEIGIFQMNSNGLQEVSNPSQIFIEERLAHTTGSVIVCTMEGNRPLLVEIQALTTPSVYGTPQRVATGFDQKRMSILLAVLEKRQGLHLGMQDVFLNVVGGVRLADPAVDLGVICAIASSFQNKEVPSQTVVVGEVGLAGEIRGATHLDLRLKEAARLGFNRALLPARGIDALEGINNMTLLPTQTVRSALAHLYS